MCGKLWKASRSDHVQAMTERQLRVKLGLVMFNHYICYFMKSRQEQDFYHLTRRQQDLKPLKGWQKFPDPSSVCVLNENLILDICRFFPLIEWYTHSYTQSYLTTTCLVRVLCCCWISSWAASKLKAFLVSTFLTLALLKLLLLFFTLAGSPPPPPLSTG